MSQSSRQHLVRFFSGMFHGLRRAISVPEDETRRRIGSMIERDPRMLFDTLEAGLSVLATIEKRLADRDVIAIVGPLDEPDRSTLAKSLEYASAVVDLCPMDPPPPEPESIPFPCACAMCAPMTEPEYYARLAEIDPDDFDLEYLGRSRAGAPSDAGSDLDIGLIDLPLSGPLYLDGDFHGSDAEYLNRSLTKPPARPTD